MGVDAARRPSGEAGHSPRGYLHLNRIRHAIRFHLVSWLRPDGTFVARKAELFSNQGAYASHGHSIVAKAMGSFPQLYPCDNFECDAYTVYTNRSAAGAMRGYGMPQASFAHEAHIEDICKALGVDSLKFRREHLMPVGFVDGFSKTRTILTPSISASTRLWPTWTTTASTPNMPTRPATSAKGIGIAPFWYNTAVWPISLEHSSCRMVLNQDGSIQVQVGETEIGQGADTAYAQMAADVVGIKDYRDVHVISCQDTDVTPFGLGAYASRQTYVVGFSITQTGKILKDKILEYARRSPAARSPIWTSSTATSSARPTAASCAACVSWPPRRSTA